MYSETIEKYFSECDNAAGFDSASSDCFIGRAGSRQVGAEVELALKSRADGTITSARFRAYGCPVGIAAASLLCERVEGLSVEQAGELGHRLLVEWLDAPPDKIQVCVLANRALHAALNRISGE